MVRNIHILHMELTPCAVIRLVSIYLLPQPLTVFFPCR